MLEGLFFDQSILFKYNTNSDEAHQPNVCSLGKFYTRKAREKIKAAATGLPWAPLEGNFECMRPAALVGRGLGRHETSYTIDPPQRKKVMYSKRSVVPSLKSVFYNTGYTLFQFKYEW